MKCCKYWKERDYIIFLVNGMIVNLENLKDFFENYYN